MSHISFIFAMNLMLSIKIIWAYIVSSSTVYHISYATNWLLIHNMALVIKLTLKSLRYIQSLFRIYDQSVFIFCQTDAVIPWFLFTYSINVVTFLYYQYVIYVSTLYHFKFIKTLCTINAHFYSSTVNTAQRLMKFRWLNIGMKSK